MIFFALKLLFAHLLGDFVFQSGKGVQDKRVKKYRSSFLYWHIGIHAILLILLLEFQFIYWKGILGILISHYLIDLAKIFLDKKGNSIILFFLDQLAHLIVILLIINYYHPFTIEFDAIYNSNTLLFGVSLITVTYVSSIIMMQLMSSWKLEGNNESDSLPRAGKYIGMLERLLVFCFIVLQQWAAIGWLLTAKSVFRFSDLTRSKDRKLTEYILIGTLLSFGLAILIGLVYLFIQENLPPA